MKQKQLSVLFLEFKEGSNQAFEKIYANTYRIVFANSYKILNDKDLAQDIVQETYLRLIENKEKVDEQKNIVNWLITVSKNLSINLAKKQSKTSSLSEGEEWKDENLQKRDQNVFTPTIDLMNKVLDEEEIKLISLILIEGYKRREISKMLSIPISTITWKYKEALKKLKKGVVKSEKN